MEGSKRSTLVSLWLAVVVGCAACHQADSKASGESSAQPKLGAATTAVTRTAAHESDCDHHHPSKPVARDKVEARKDADGKSYLHTGQELAGVTQVAVADLLDKSKDYAGKIVAVSGRVSAMCHGRRSWFAVVGKDQAGIPLRVLTAPKFLVPQGSIGKQVKVEGTVGIIQIKKSMAKHLAKGHKMPMPDGTAETHSQTVLRATGADFY